MSGKQFRAFAFGCGVGALLSIDVQGRHAAPFPAIDETNGAARAATLRAQGLELGYNLDYPEALAAFRDAIEADPQDPTNERLAAATLWMRPLFEQGAVTVEDYLGQARSNIPRKKPLRRPGHGV